MPGPPPNLRAEDPNEQKLKIYFLPNLLTGGNLFCGFTATLKILEGALLQASNPDAAGDLFHAALPALTHLSSPRAWAYALLGLDEYLRVFQGDTSVQAMRGLLTARLLDLYQRASAEDWPWFEDHVTYCNARLPQALIVSGTAMGREDLVTVGTRTGDG